MSKSPRHSNFSAMVLVTFLVHAEVSIGETVCLSGSCAELGSFQSNSALEMTTDPQSFPIWKVKVLLPRNIQVSYRYLTTGFGRVLAWEPNNPRPRTFRVGDKPPVLDYFGMSPPTASAPMLDSPSSSFRNVKRPLNNKICIVAFHVPFKLYLRNRSSNSTSFTDDEEWDAEFDLDNPAAATSLGVVESEITYIGAVTPKSVVNLEEEDIAKFFDMSPQRKRGITRALGKCNCHPLFLTSELYSAFYSQFCQQVLWDVFHNVLVPPESYVMENSYKQGYCKGNELFAEFTKAHLQGDELVWVHGYHLMLLPALFLEQRTPVIFFLHVPFPTSEVFRVLPMCEDLLNAMLSSSTVGFHTFNHARHFITSCRRVLGAQSRSYGDSGALAIEYGGRRILLTVSHLGVDSGRIERSIESETVHQHCEDLSRELNSASGQTTKVVFGSLDELQRLSGVALKLLAFERFLEVYPKWHQGRAKFVLWTTARKTLDVAANAAEDESCKRYWDYKISRNEVCLLVARINAKFGNVVLHREFASPAQVTFEERLALWLSTDVFVSTPVCEGLNLHPLEFTMCKSKSNPGVVILSEFSTCASVLNGAVRVNCYDITNIAKQLFVTATMPISEKHARFMRDVDNISTPTAAWAQHVVDEAMEVLEDRDFHFIEPLAPQQILQYYSLAKCLRMDNVIRAYENTERRIIFLDLGGTLVELEDHVLSFKRDFLGTLGAGLSKEMETTLLRLCKDDRNLVFIVSRDNRHVLTRVFYSLLNQNLGLVAHSGLCVRLPMLLPGSAFPVDEQELKMRKMTMWEEKLASAAIRAHHVQEQKDQECDEDDELLGSEVKITAALEEVDSNGSIAFDTPRTEEWITIVNVQAQWQQWMQSSGIADLMHQYTWNTVGSICKLSEVSTCWEYQHADPEFGMAQSRCLVVELEEAIAKHKLNCTVRHTRNSVEVLPSGVHKGLAVRKILAMLPALKPTWNGRAADFCLALGDGSTDEFMFAAVHQHFTRLDSSKVFTATVGRKPTTAQYYVKDTHVVADLLGHLGE